MKKYLAVVLRHETRTGGHYDWMFEAPPAKSLGAQRLWTFRVNSVLGLGRQRRVFVADRIQDHRREYLTYQGPIGGCRGHVVRVDEGYWWPRKLTGHRIVMALDMRERRGHIVWSKIAGSIWRGCWDADASVVRQMICTPRLQVAAKTIAHGASGH